MGKCALWCFLIYYQLPSETKRAHMALKLHAIVMPRICLAECGRLCLIFKLSFFQMTGYHQRKYCVIFCMNPKTIQLFSEWVGILNSQPPFFLYSMIWWQIDGRLNSIQIRSHSRQYSRLGRKLFKLLRRRRLWEKLQDSRREKWKVSSGVKRSRKRFLKRKSENSLENMERVL